MFRTGFEHLTGESLRRPVRHRYQTTGLSHAYHLASRHVRTRSEHRTEHRHYYVEPPVLVRHCLGVADIYVVWQAHALDRETPSLDRRRRAVIARAVANRIGDTRELGGDPVDELDHALVELADIVTLAPWRLGPAAYQRVRSLGLAGDAQVFDAVATASSCTVLSRIATVLAGFAR